MKNLQATISVFVLASILKVSCQASTHIDKREFLFGWLDSFTSLKGDFVQRQEDSAGLTVSESRGEFSILKPNYFRWELTHPDRQLFISDAEYIWHYDKDLQTASRRTVTGEISSLQILLGNSRSVQDEFTITQTSDKSQFLMVPKSLDPLFSFVRLEFRDEVLTEISLAGKFEYELIITISDLRYNSPLGIADFQINTSDDTEILFDEIL